MSGDASPPCCGRYAPSPTGALHRGNLRTALLAWLHARLHRGRFILRMDDLDGPRNRPGAAEQIIADLLWLGLDWDSEPVNQTDREHYYQAAFDRLLASGSVFPCRCSRRDIAEALSAPHGSTRSGIYPGTCRPVTPVQNMTGIATDVAWRFRVDHRVVAFEDRLSGHFSQSLDLEVGDFVIKRRDGLFAYQLATVVDDIAMGITDVVRGDDLLDSTPRQIALFEALGESPPAFWHVPLMRDAAGQRLAKRDGSDSVASSIERGQTAASLVGDLAASCGLVPPGSELSARELVQDLTPSRFRNALAGPDQNGQSGVS